MNIYSELRKSNFIHSLNKKNLPWKIHPDKKNSLSKKYFPLKNLKFNSIKLFRMKTFYLL